MTRPFSRRHFLKGSSLALGAAVAAQAGLRAALDPAAAWAAQSTPKATVYFTTDLSAAGLRAIYAKVCQPLTETAGGKVAVKVHTGEPDGPNILPRPWIRELLPLIPNPTLVECNVLYPSPRQKTAEHRQTLKTNGWDFAPVDIMDAEGDALLPVRGGKWISELAVGKHLLNYDAMLVLTHFKGHSMGGFGGSLKNISIGCASGTKGKEQLHREGDQLWAGGPNFMQRMVEGGKAITDHFGPRITYINVLRNMSVDCDCAGTSAEAVTTPDIGIVASTDVLAVDQASVDMVYKLPPAQRKALVERIESRSGLEQLAHMHRLGMGSREYTLVTL